MPTTPDETISPFQEAVRGLLAAYGIEQKELAGRLRMDEGTVSRWVNGRTTPPPGVQRRIEDAIGIRQGALDDPRYILKMLKEGQAERLRIQRLTVSPEAIAVAEQRRMRAERAGLSFQRTIEDSELYAGNGGGWVLYDVLIDLAALLADHHAPNADILRYAKELRTELQPRPIGRGF